jgi:hypothetical protein
LDKEILEYAPPSIGKSDLDDPFKRSGVTYADHIGNFSFADKSQLLAAARIYASRLVGSAATRYRLASSDADVKALRDEVATAISEAKHNTPAPQAPGAPGTAASQAPVSVSENAGNIRLILDGLRHNVFVERNQQTGAALAGISLGTYGYDVTVSGNESRNGRTVHSCRFDQFRVANGKINDAVSYIDLECDGRLATVKKNQGQPAQPTDQDIRTYGLLLEFFTKLVPMMQAYKITENSVYKHGVHDLELAEKNKSLMEQILGEIDRSRATVADKDRHTLSFIGSNGKEISITAQISGNHYSTCVLHEKDGRDVFYAIDDGCNGSIDAYEYNNKSEEVDKWVMAPLANSMLRNLEHLTRLTSEMFPKQ